MNYDWDDEQSDGDWGGDETGAESVEDPSLDLGDEDEASTAALLPNRSGVLILSGAGAGTVVTEPSGPSSVTLATLKTRDQALSGTAPLLIVHRPYRYRGQIPRLLASVVRATAGSVALGAASPLPKGTAESHRLWLDGCAGASVLIADPMGFLLDSEIVRVNAPTERNQGWMPYLQNNPLDVVEVLEAQRQVGANLLLSPGRALDAANPQPALDIACAQGDEALTALQPGERLALNLTLPAQWLSRPALRDQLLNQLLDQEQFDIWYVRVQWPSTLRATEQPTADDLLQGYKRLSQLAVDEERVLLLPQSGLTGWLQLAFGASGLGSGLSGSDQAFKEPVGGGTGAPQLERYFEPALLHWVERTVHDVLRGQASYVACDCPYCPALHATTPWSHELAALHGLHWTGRLCGLAAESGRGGPAAAVRRTVRAAVAAASTQPLAALSQPRHLAAWDRLL